MKRTIALKQQRKGKSEVSTCSHLDWEVINKLETEVKGLFAILRQ